MKKYFPKKDMNHDPRFADEIAIALNIVNAMNANGSQDWTRVVENCGLQVFCAV